MILVFNTICSLQQLKMLFNDFFSLVLVCKDIEPSLMNFFSTVRVVICESLEAFTYEIFRVAIF